MDSALNPLAGNPLRTRDDLRAALVDCYAPLIARRTADGARLRPDGTAASYDDGAAALESFARPLWGLAGESLLDCAVLASPDRERARAAWATPPGPGA